MTEGKRWSKTYTAILIWNGLLIVAFYLFMQYFNQ